ncbi:hypothetical protein [Shewanella sp.]|uniref:hypothetical protein n=1 Tax=Shewanella sp. TaxID=50422 RepID=UPI00259074BB|nr:hypothetical protein [Shewanella sp.]MCJ8303307.1 hypothetical protein [Shewanella sp.]
MYSILLLIFLTLFTGFTNAASSVSKDVNVNVFIVKNSNSSELSIEADKSMFTAMYDTKNQSFSDLDMGFTISSPATNNKDYEIELMGSDHQCDGDPLAVITRFDDDPFVVDNVTPAMSFQTTKNGLRTSQHKFTLIYPTLAQTDSEQVCNGTLSVYARLKI